MERMDKGAAPVASVRPGNLVQLEAFYEAEYSKLVKILVVFDATVEDAEDAAQKAMGALARRCKAGTAPARNPAAWVRRAAIRFFIKERQRDRGRLPREIKGGHLVLDASTDTDLTAWEDEQRVEHLLACLTPAQRDVLRRVMDGASTREIAEELGKRDENIRQHLKNSRDRLKAHPEIAPLVPRDQAQHRAQQGVTPRAVMPEPRKEEVQ